MASLPTPDRTCWHCDTPIQGRADKKFCSSACKASYSRQAPSAPAAPIAAPAAKRLPSVSRPAERTASDWQGRCEAAEHALQAYEQQAAHERAVATSYLQEYVRLTQLLWQSDQAGWTLPRLHAALSQLTTAIYAYQQHPYLTDPLYVARWHLAELTFTRDYLQRNSTWLLDHKSGSHPR